MCWTQVDSAVLVFQVTAAAAQANLLKQQEELERKAAELDRREQELQSRGPSGKVDTMTPPGSAQDIVSVQDFLSELL